MLLSAIEITYHVLFMLPDTIGKYVNNTGPRKYGQNETRLNFRTTLTENNDKNSSTAVGLHAFSLFPGSETKDFSPRKYGNLAVVCRRVGISRQCFVMLYTDYALRLSLVTEHVIRRFLAYWALENFHSGT